MTFYLTDPSTNRAVPAVVDDPLYRVETGNYDYRVVLRCRQLGRAKFAKARNDVMVKLELLEAKHVQVKMAMTPFFFFSEFCRRHKYALEN